MVIRMCMVDRFPVRVGERRITIDCRASFEMNVWNCLDWEIILNEWFVHRMRLNNGWYSDKEDTLSQTTVHSCADRLDTEDSRWYPNWFDGVIDWSWNWPDRSFVVGRWKWPEREFYSNLIESLSHRYVHFPSRSGLQGCRSAWRENIDEDPIQTNDWSTDHRHQPPCKIFEDLRE